VGLLIQPSATVARPRRTEARPRKGLLIQPSATVAASAPSHRGSATEGLLIGQVPWPLPRVSSAQGSLGDVPPPQTPAIFRCRTLTRRPPAFHVKRCSLHSIFKPGTPSRKTSVMRDHDDDPFY
jgi:hypothetical protein